MGQFLRVACIVAVCAAMLSACNTSGCQDNGSAIPLAGFYSSSTAREISLDSLAIFGLDAPADSALVRPGAAISEVYLPMRAGEDRTVWKFEYKQRALDHPANYDTITLAYESIPYFASVDCGAMYAYRLRSVAHTTHLIDSITVTDSLITNTDVRRLLIYFRTSGEGENR